MFGASEGDGILIFTAYGIQVYFQGLAFDTAGTLKVRKEFCFVTHLTLKVSPTLDMLFIR